MTEWKFPPFEIDISSFEIQFLDLKTKRHGTINSNVFGNSQIGNIGEEKSVVNNRIRKIWSALNDLEKEDKTIFNA